MNRLDMQYLRYVGEQHGVVMPFTFFKNVALLLEYELVTVEFDELFTMVQVDITSLGERFIRWTDELNDNRIKKMKDKKKEPRVCPKCRATIYGDAKYCVCGTRIRSTVIEELVDRIAKGC